jgi:hypothetical protein
MLYKTAWFSRILALSAFQYSAAASSLSPLGVISPQGLGFNNIGMFARLSSWSMLAKKLLLVSFFFYNTTKSTIFSKKKKKKKKPGGTFYQSR